MLIIELTIPLPHSTSSPSNLISWLSSSSSPIVAHAQNHHQLFTDTKALASALTPGPCAYVWDTPNCVCIEGFYSDAELLHSQLTVSSRLVNLRSVPSSTLASIE